ncbi:MAG: hypothetical protein ACLVAW_08310 [Eisenbergiella massiliensis]
MREESKRLRVLWLCNICPPSAAAALGRSYSVREGWLTGALNRYLADEEQDLELGICFPSEEEELSQFSGRIKLKELTDAPEAGEKEVYVYGFRENLKRPELYDLAMEKRFAGILADFKPDLVHIFGTGFPCAGHGEKLSAAGTDAGGDPGADRRVRRKLYGGSAGNRTEKGDLPGSAEKGQPAYAAGKVPYPGGTRAAGAPGQRPCDRADRF